MTTTHLSREPIRVLAILGSLRAGSHNTAILRAAAEPAPAGIEVERYDGLDRIPAYNEDHDGPTAELSVTRSDERIGAAGELLDAETREQLITLLEQLSAHHQRAAVAA